MSARASATSRRIANRSIFALSDSAADVAALPSRIGRYEVQAECGRGSVVRVFSGYDRDARRPVTLKLLTSESPQRSRDRFLSEAATAAKLHEPAVSAIYEISEYDGQPFVAMQSPDGERLPEIIKKPGALPMLAKASIMWRVGRGLDSLQSAGIVAGVRPGDIVVGPNGTATLADFGALRLLPTDAEHDDAYRSPEEAAGAAPNFGSDIFSFGAIYIALLTGKAPGPAALPFCDLPPDCPKALHALLRQAVEKSPDGRYHGFSELQCDAAVILADLKRAHVAAALPEIRSMLERGELSQAYERLTDLLQIDSGNRAANRLIGELGSRLRQRTTASRLASLDEAVDAAVSRADWDGAIELLRSAARVDGDNPELSRRLGQLEARVQQAQKYHEAFSKGRGLANDGHLLQAREALRNALQIEPRGLEAQELLQHVDAQILAEEQSRLSQAIQEADLLISNDRPDLALEALRESAAGLPAGSGVESRIAELESILPAWKARHAVRDALARAAALEQLNEPADALRVLEETATAYPDCAELADVMSELRGRCSEHERRTRLERRLQAFRRLADSHDWPRAVRLLESSLLEFPEEPTLKRELAGARESLRSSECERVCAEAQRLVAAGELSEARCALEEAVGRIGNDPAISTLLEQIGRRAADDADWETAKALFGRRQFEDAEQILTRLAERGRAEAAALLEMVRSARAIRVEEEFYEEGRNRALRLVEAGDHERAAELLRNLLALFPDDPILLRRLATAEAIVGRKEIPGAPDQLKDTPAAEGPAKNIAGPPSFADHARPSFWRRRGPAIAVLIVTIGAFAGFVVGRHKRNAPSAPPLPAVAPRRLEAKNEVVSAVVLAEPLSAQTTAPAANTQNPPARETRPGETKVYGPQKRFVVPELRSTAAATREDELPAATQVSVQAQTPAAPWIATPVAGPPPPAVATPREPAPTPRDATSSAGPSAQPAKALRTPAPAMPAFALQRGIHGEVKLDATIAKDGAVREVKAISGEPILVQAAKQAVLKWRFQPATLNGVAVESHRSVLVVFEGRP